METSQKVTILTSCYNGGKHIEQYKLCLLSQTHRPLECIIVNDGSEDDSKQLLDELAIAATQRGIETRVLHQKNTGNAIAISKAYEISTGELIVCWDIDDIFFPENIAILVEALRKSPECAAAHANGYYVNESATHVNINTFSNKHPNYTGNNLFVHLLAASSWNWSGSYMVKSAVLERLYGSRVIPTPRLWKNSQNLQFLLPASYFGSIYTPHPIMKYVLRSNSISHINSTYEEDIRRINAYEDIRIQLLEQMNARDERFRDIVKTSFCRIKMMLAYQYNNKNDFALCFNELKQAKLLTTEDMILKGKIFNDNVFLRLYYKCRHKLHLRFPHHGNHNR